MIKYTAALASKFGIIYLIESGGWFTIKLIHKFGCRFGSRPDAERERWQIMKLLKEEIWCRVHGRVREQLGGQIHGRVWMLIFDQLLDRIKQQVVNDAIT